MGLETLDGQPVSEPKIKRATPPVGHSITQPSTAVATKGSTSSGGASGAQLNEIQAVRFQALNKANWTEETTSRFLSRLDKIQQYLGNDENFIAKLDKASLKDMALIEAIYTDKIMTLTGKATQIIGIQHQEKMDEILPLLMQTLQQRGLSVTATERKLELNSPA